MGFRKPHDPYIAPRKYFEPYPLEKIACPEGPPGDEKDIPAAAYPPARWSLGREESREYRRAYYACTTFMDAQLGKVLRALEASPAAGNTIVIFFGDHGLHLGEHGWFNKVTLFERSARVPLIIAPAGAAAPGAVCRRPVELLGLYPTLAELCKVTPPPGLEGESLAPLLRNPEGTWSRPAYTVVARGGRLGRAIRTERFRYTEWDEGRAGVELYDHFTDPHEYHNLSGDPDYARVEREMKQTLASAGPKNKPA